MTEIIRFMLFFNFSGNIRCKLRHQSSWSCGQILQRMALADSFVGCMVDFSLSVKYIQNSRLEKAKEEGNTEVKTYAPECFLSKRKGNHMITGFRL